MTQRKKSLLVFLFFSCDATRPTWALAVSLGKISRGLSLSVSAKYAGEFRISPSWRLFACLVRNPGGIIPIKIFVLVSFRRRAQGAFSSRAFHSKLRVPTCHEGKSHRSSPTRRACADRWLARAPAKFFLFVSIKKNGHLSTGRARAQLHNAGWCTCLESWTRLFFSQDRVWDDKVGLSESFILLFLRQLCVKNIIDKIHLHKTYFHHIKFLLKTYLGVHPRDWP